MNALVLGATGLCGSAMLKAAIASGKYSEVTTITRRSLPFESSAKQIVEEDNSKWASLISADIECVFTALAITKAAAGGLENQYKIDHDLNIELIKAAKAKGCKTVVLISSTGASTSSMFAYMKLKGEIERDLIALDFDRTIILRPGLLLGERDSVHKGFGNGIGTWIGSKIYRSPLQSTLGYPVYSDEIGIVCSHLATQSAGEKVQIVESREILSIADSLKKK